MLIIEHDGESFEVCLAELPEADPAPAGCHTKFSLDTFAERR
jgi:hypothetical protein